MPANAIVVDRERGAILVGTDIGVFETMDEGRHWRQLTKGMPNVAVFGLANDKEGRIVAATHGRGMFELSRRGRGGDGDDRDTGGKK